MMDTIRLFVCFCRVFPHLHPESHHLATGMQLIHPQWHLQLMAENTLALTRGSHPGRAAPPPENLPYSAPGGPSLTPGTARVRRRVRGPQPWNRRAGGHLRSELRHPGGPRSQAPLRRGFAGAKRRGRSVREGFLEAAARARTSGELEAAGGWARGGGRRSALMR